METILLVIHLLIAIALVAVILMQRSEGGALGMGGGGGAGGGSGFMSGRAAADVLTRTTAILATCFICTSIVLAILAGSHRESGSILDQTPAPSSTPAAPSSTPTVPAPTTPTQ